MRTMSKQTCIRYIAFVQHFSTTKVAAKPVFTFYFIVISIAGIIYLCDPGLWNACKNSDSVNLTAQTIAFLGDKLIFHLTNRV